MRRRSGLCLAFGGVVGFAIFIGCSVTIEPGGGEPGVAFTIAGTTITFTLGTSSTFDVPANSDAVRKAVEIPLFDDTPSDTPATGELTLDANRVQAVPLDIPKRLGSAQTITGSATIVVYIASSAAENPCTEGVNIGSFGLTFADGVVTLDRSSLALPPEVLVHVITGTFRMCLEVTASVSVTITVDEMGCVFGPSLEPGGCITSADCAAGETCLSGACVPSPVGCSSDTDCPAGESCVLGECEPISVGCTSDADCSAGETCVGGDCVPVTVGCTSDSDCDAGETCVDGDCQPETGGCTSDADCDAGETCVVGVCVPLGTECTTDTDCGPDETCEAGFCLSADECTSDTDCGPGEMCVLGLCVPVTTTCTSDTECPTGDVCFAGLCIPNIFGCSSDLDCGPDERCIEGVCESGIGPDDLPSGFEWADIDHVGSEQIIVGEIADEAGGFGFVPDPWFGVTHLALSGDGLSLWFATKWFAVSNPPSDTQRLYHIKTDGRSLQRSPVPLDSVNDGTDPVFQRLATDDTGGVAILSVTRTVPPTIFGDTEAAFFFTNPGLEARLRYDTTIDTPEPQPGAPASPPRSLQVNNVGTHFSWNDEKNIWRYPIDVENTVPALEIVVSESACDFATGREFGEFDRSASDLTTILHFWSDPPGTGLCNTLLYAPPSATPSPQDLARTDYSVGSVHVDDTGTLMAYCLCCGADPAQCYVYPPGDYIPGAGFELTPTSDTWNQFYDLVLADGGLRYRAIVTDFVGTSDAVSFFETVGGHDRRMTGTATFGAVGGGDFNSVQLSFDGSVMAAMAPLGVYVLHDGQVNLSGFPSITRIAYGYDEEADTLTFRVQAESDNGIEYVYVLPMKDGIGPEEFLPIDENPFFAIRGGSFTGTAFAPVEGSTETYEITADMAGKWALVDDSYDLRFVVVDGTTSRTVFADIHAPQPPPPP